MTRNDRILTITALVLLLALATALRLLTYDRFLPLLDYSDETNMFLLALDMRGDEVPLAADYGAPLTGEWLAGYPPLHPWLGVWTGRLLEATSDRFLFPGDYIGTMRLLSVAANVATVGVLFVFGVTLTAAHGPRWGVLGGMLTALPYAVSPQIIDIGNLAIPDSLIPLGCALALFGAVRAITHDRPAWLVVSLLGAVAAIYLKYSVMVGLWATFCGVVVLVRRRGLRAMLPWLALLAVISAVTAGYLLWGYGALGLENREAANFRETGLANMFNFDRNRRNFMTALRVSVPPLLFALGLLGGLVATWRGWASRVNWRWLWMLAPFIVGNILLTSSVVYADPQFGGYGRVRFVFPAAIALSAVWALALVGLARWLANPHPQPFPESVVSTQPRQQGKGAGQRVNSLVIIGVFIAVLLIPALRADAALITRYRTTDTTLLLWRYTESSVPNTGTVLTPRDSRVHLTWNRPYSGYTGDKTFTWTYDNAPYQTDPAALYADGVHYVAYTLMDRITYLNVDAMNPWEAQLYPLKTIDAEGAGVSGETTFFYRTLPPVVETNVRFGERIRMVGHDSNLTPKSPLRTQRGDLQEACERPCSLPPFTGEGLGMGVKPGSVLHFRPYWQADATPEAAYSVSVRLTPVDDPDTVIAQQDGPPVDADRPTLTWDDPDEVLIGTEAVLTVPPETPPGDYALTVILYDFQSGARLPVGDEEGYTIPVVVE